MKLNPDAFLELYHFHNRNFYSQPGFLTFHGHLVLAADGSDLNVPTTKETLERYGTASRKNTKPQAQIGLGCIYDVMNRMILESDCNRVKFDEMRLAERQLERISQTIGENQPYLILMDRGYPSTPSFIHLIEKEIPFLVRLKTSDYKKEQQDLTVADCMVPIGLDKSRIHHYEGTADGERMKQLGEIKLRMVKIELGDGKSEVLATNLPNEFTTKEIEMLYHMRWGIETAYETLKSRLQIENFTGTRPRLLEQDIYSTIYISNLAEDIIRDAELEMEGKNQNHKMAVNQTLGIGILKNDLIYILLEKNPQKQNEYFQKIYEDIRKNLVPVRPDRHYERTKGQLAGKYSNTHKRAY